MNPGVFFYPFLLLNKKGKQKRKPMYTTSMSLLFNFVGFQFPAIIITKPLSGNQIPLFFYENNSLTKMKFYNLRNVL